MLHFQGKSAENMVMVNFKTGMHNTKLNKLDVILFDLHQKQMPECLPMYVESFSSLNMPVRPSQSGLVNLGTC